MKEIKIQNLPEGSNLLSDSESYLSDLNDRELNVTGGMEFICTSATPIEKTHNNIWSLKDKTSAHPIPTIAKL
jgi:hypothetical protein